MSSSPLTSSEQAANAEEIHGEEELESLDESLDAILSEASGVPTGELPATSTSPHEPPPAEVHVAMGLPAIEALGDDSETPLPVIVDELPSYQAFADEVAPAIEETTAQTATEKATEEAMDEQPAPELAAARAEPKDDEIVDAESLVESMTPAPVVEPDREALLVTEESAAFVLPPPTDEQILENVVLPPGSTPMPMPVSLSASALEQPPGAELEDDHTVISPNPPQPEPSLPVPVFRSAWSQTTPVIAAPLPEPTMPMLLTRSEGLGDKLLKVASSRVQASVAQLAIVVIAASALGGAVMKLASRPQPGLRPAAVAASVEGPKAEPPAAAPAPAATPEPTPAAPAPTVAEKPAEKAAVAAHPAAAHAKAKSAPAQTHIALAAPPSKSTAAAKHTAAAAPAAKAKKPAGHGPAQSGGWVDPFGQ